MLNDYDAVISYLYCGLGAARHESHGKMHIRNMLFSFRGLDGWSVKGDAVANDLLEGISMGFSAAAIKAVMTYAGVSLEGTQYTLLVMGLPWGYVHRLVSTLVPPKWHPVMYGCNMRLSRGLL
jgi:hypothetical protein